MPSLKGVPSSRQQVGAVPCNLSNLLESANTNQVAAMPEQNLTLALVGLGFGAEFLPIYLHHPLVEEVMTYDLDTVILEKLDEQFGITEHPQTFDSILNNPDIDAVHLVTRIPDHANNTLSVLEAGKHCACTVPMATSLEDLHAIVNAQAQSDKNYMMMETSVYTREFMYVRDLVQRGELGKLQFLRGAHYQDMDGWPSYWEGLPPMHYATHAISPLLALANTKAANVHCFGSGTMRDALKTKYGNPYPVETAIFQLENGLAAEVTRTLFEVAHPYTESFSVYGDSKGFEWQQLEEEKPLLFELEPFGEKRGRHISTTRIEPPDQAELLPPSIARFTTRGVYDQTNSHRSFLQGGGHGGSHPHLVHEFVSSIVEKRKPWPDAVTAANWTAAGICAHTSAMNNGKGISLPNFS